MALEIWHRTRIHVLLSLIIRRQLYIFTTTPATNRRRWTCELFQLFRDHSHRQSSRRVLKVRSGVGKRKQPTRLKILLYAVNSYAITAIAAAAEGVPWLLLYFRQLFLWNSYLWHLRAEIWLWQIQWREMIGTFDGRMEEFWLNEIFYLSDLLGGFVGF